MTEKIAITFLGTGSAVPTKARNHTGILISRGAENILVDCGEGMQRQFKMAKQNPCKITRILITHWHGDHTLGIPGLLETLAMSEYSKTLQIYGPRGTKKRIELFEKIYGKFRLKFEVKEIGETTTLDERELVIKAAPMKHGIPTLGYALIIKEKRRLNKQKIKKLNIPNSPLLGKLQQGKNIIHPKTKKTIKASQVTYMQPEQKIAIVLDTAMNANARKLAKDADVFICESSFTTAEAEKAEQYHHLTAIQSATLAKEAGAKKLALTHISQRYQQNAKPILKEAKTVFKNTVLPDDLQTITL